MKKRLLCTLALLVGALALFSGCRKGPEQTGQTGLWQGEELYFAQFGVPLEQALENLGIPQDSLTEGDHGDMII